MEFLNIEDGINYLFRQYRVELRDPPSLRGFLRVAFFYEVDKKWNVVELKTKYTQGLLPNKEEIESGARNLGSLIREEFGITTTEAGPEFFEAFDKARRELENKEKLFPNNVFVADPDAYPEQAWLYDILRSKSTPLTFHFSPLQVKRVVIVFFSTFPTPEICLKQLESLKNDSGSREKLLRFLLQDKKFSNTPFEFRYQVLEQDERGNRSIREEKLKLNHIQRKKTPTLLKAFGVVAVTCVLFAVLRENKNLPKGRT